MGVTRARASKILTDADIPAAIARDTETAAAIANHEGKPDPHPSLWQRIVAEFLSLAGGQRILKNNPPITYTSFFGGANHLELTTDNGSNPIIGFHKGGISATSLYHAGYGNETLRVMNADGMNVALIHDGNIGSKTAGNANRAATADNVGGVFSTILSVSLPAQASTTGSVGLGSIDPAKIVGLSAIATCSIAGSIFYVPPYGGLGSSSGFEYGLYASKVSGSNYLNLWTATAARSQSILGAPVKILVNYIQ